MKVAVLANDLLKDELLSQGLLDGCEINWVNTVEELVSIEQADAYFDLLFDNDKKRIERLITTQNVPVIINSVIDTLESLPAHFVRINGWPTFLKRTIVEAACYDSEIKKEAEKIISCFNKKIEWIDDIPGFITARVVASVINEAYFTLEENVSTKAEIDTAMKLGTNYPFGPFEWSEKIGLKNIHTLLFELSKKNKRYQPCNLLSKEAML